MANSLFVVRDGVAPDRIAEAISNLSYQLEGVNQATVDLYCNHRPSASPDEHNRLGWLLWAQQSLIEQQRLLCARLDELPLEAAEPAGGEA